MKKIKKYYFYPLGLIFNCINIGLLSIGLTIFLSVGLTIGINNLNKNEVIYFGLGIFGLLICLELALLLFFRLNYWTYNDKGITNGGAFWRRTLYFSEITDVKTKSIAVPSIKSLSHENYVCFYKKKSMVSIPCNLIPELKKELCVLIEKSGFLPDEVLKNNN